MYTRKIYEPESKFSLQTARTPGASARGNAHGDKGTELPSSKVPAWTTIDTSVEKTVQQRRKNGSGQLEPVSPYRAKERVLDEDVPNLFRVDTAIVEHHVKNYVNDFGRWYSQSMREIGDMGWSERRSSVVPLERKAEEFSNRNDELRMYIDVNKDKLDHEYYTTVASFLTDQKTNTEGLRELHRTKREMLEQFDSQASYDAFLADQAERQRLLDLDIERQREEIDSLKVTLEEFTENDRQYRLTSINPFAALNKNSAGIISRNQELRGLYGSPEEMEEMIESMQRECEEARRLQARVKIPQTVMMAPDFETMSRYTPIEIDIGSNGIGDAIYTFINMQDNSDDGLKMWRDTLFSDYRYLTEKEIRIFNYCYNTGNYEIGKAYLDGLTETLNQRKAERRFEDFEGKTGKEILYGIDVGLDQFASGIYATGKMLFGDESDPVISEQEFLAGMIREDLKDNGAKLPQWMGGASLGQTAYDAVATASYMLPNELAAIAANAVLPGSGKIVGNAMVWASAGGNAYTEAKRMGFGEEQASAYALLIGGSEAGLGWLLGGIEKLGGGLTQKLIGKVLPRVDNAAAKVAMRYGGNIIAEGNEEYLQTILEPVFKKIALNINEDIDWEEAAYAWFLGVLSSAEIGGAEIVADFGKRIGITDPKLLGNALRDYDPASLGEPGKTGPTPVLAPVEKASPEMWTPLQPRTQPDRAADSGTQPESPYFTPDIRTNELDGVWTEADADLWTQSDAETQQKPLRYEDQPRPYPDGDTSPSANPKVLTVSNPVATPATDLAVIPKPKEQIISELAPKILKPGITPGRAAIAAQEMYAEAEKWYGSNAATVLERFQPGQDPRKFLDGVQNAYLAGKMGNKAALKNSSAAAYLTEEQRNTAYDLSRQEGRWQQLDYANDNGIIAAGSVLDHFDRKIRLSDVSEDLKKVNPNYSSREYRWTHNCQRCVATYEMRRRGFNVTAKPVLVDAEEDFIAKNWSKVWTNDPPLLCRIGNGKAQIEAQMKLWGDGARAVVCVEWKKHGSAHTFIAENRNGTVVFIDPQTGNEDCSHYFGFVKEGYSKILRVDKFTPSDLILECCQNVR